MRQFRTSKGTTKLALLMKERKMAQRDLCELTDIEPNLINRLMMSNRVNTTLVTAKKICKALNVSLSLFDDFDLIGYYGNIPHNS